MALAPEIPKFRNALIYEMNFWLPLFHEGNISGDALLILQKGAAELRRQQPVFNAHANFRANHKQDNRWSEKPPRSHQKSRPQQHAKHRSVNGMPYKAIRSGHDQFMIRVQSRIEAPLSAQSARAGPGHQRGNRNKQNGKCNLPSLRRALPELPLPQKRIADCLEYDSPACALVDISRLRPFTPQQEKRSDPDHPSYSQNLVYIRRRHTRSTSQSGT